MNTEEQGQNIYTPPSKDTTDNKPKAPAKAKKVFTREDIRRHVEVGVILPDLYPDYDPWWFKLRLKLSKEQEEKRQEFMALAPADQTTKQPEENLDELCDLLIDYPEGFGDLQKSLQPGPAFRDYVVTADPHMKEILFNIAEGAMVLYWRKLSPREFRRTV